MGKERTDAERRSRQCAKFARLIKIARLLMGNGRWGPEDLAKEVECSTRTIFRDIEILSASGIPLIYDKEIQAYRVREGFRFSGLDPKIVDTRDSASPAIQNLLVNARRMIKEGELFLENLRRLCDQLHDSRKSAS